MQNTTLISVDDIQSVRRDNTCLFNFSECE